MPAKLTAQELAFLESFLNAGDRGGFYMAYYNITSNEGEASEQAFEQPLLSPPPLYFQDLKNNRAYCAGYRHH